MAAQSLMASRLEDAVAMARRDQRSTDVFLALDLDGFTGIGASYGQEAAALLLEAVGKRLHACLRPTDIIARYGCDEFGILVRCTSDSPLVETVSARVQQQLSAPFLVCGQDIAVTASVGIARVLPDHESAADVRRDAYAAVHHAKIVGGNRCAMFDDGMHQKTRARLQLEAELRHAVERGEFRLHFQPIVALCTGALSSLEALIRWNHPVRGCLPPSQFLDALGASSLRAEVGRWILTEACQHLVQWQRVSGYEGSVSVNIAPRQLLEPGFVETILAIFAYTGASPSRVELEITEDTALDGDAAMAMLAELRDCGIRVRIDDFGTGYSSLSYLHRMPVGGLKIDRNFLHDIELDPRRREIVGAIIRLAHELGLEVVAEGTERRAQLDVLHDLHCDFVQGFFVARPLPEEEVASWIANAGNTSHLLRRYRR